MAAILVVDDDDTIRDTLYDLFADEHLCHAAETVEKAVGYLESEAYDVVLTDISMPGLSGLELLGHVRQRQPDTPVIIITGISDRTYAEGLLKLGAFDFLLKPFRLEMVEESVTRALAHRRELVEQRRRGDRSEVS